MDEIDDYEGYDYPEMGYQDSQKESSEEISYGERADKSSDNFQGTNMQFFS